MSLREYILRLFKPREPQPNPERLSMPEDKKVYVTTGNPLGGIGYETYAGPLNTLKLNEAFIFYRHGRYELDVSYLVKRVNEDGDDYVINIDSPIEDEVPALTKIYSEKKEGFIPRKLEAILRTCPVGIVVPDKTWAGRLEREVRKLGYEFEFVDAEKIGF